MACKALHGPGPTTFPTHPSPATLDSFACLQRSRCTGAFGRPSLHLNISSLRHSRGKPLLPTMSLSTCSLPLTLPYRPVFKHTDASSCPSSASPPTLRCQLLAAYLIYFFRLFPLERRLPKGRKLCLLCLLMYPKPLEQGLDPWRHSAHFC